MCSFEPKEILEALPSKYYVININTKKILASNDPDFEKETTCHHFLFNRDSLCQNKDGQCICQQSIKDRKKSFRIKKGEGDSLQFYEAKVSLLKEDVAIVNYMDVTTEVKSSKKLKISHRRLKKAQELASFGYWEFDVAEQTITSSLGLQAIYGFSEKEITWEKMQKLALPKYRKIVAEKLHSLIHKGKPYNIRFEIKRNTDGEIRWVHSIAEYRGNKNKVFGIVHDITEPYNTKEALNETLIDLSLAQEISKTGNWKYNPRSKSTLWSKQLYAVFERDLRLPPPSSEELKKCCDSTGYSHYKIKMYEAIEKGVSFELQMKIKTFRGKSKWIKVICHPDEKCGDGGYFLRGTLQDITESKKVEEELNHSGELLRTIIEHIPDAIYMKDKRFRKTIANKGDMQNCGVKSIDELLGKTDHEIFPKEVADFYFEDDKQVIQKGIPVINREEILPDKNSGQRWLLTTKIPLWNNENKIIGLVGIGRDITELKQKELRLQLLQQTIEQSPLSITITNQEGHIEYVNSAFSKITGYSRDEILGRPSSMLLEAGENNENYRRVFQNTIQSGQSWSGELLNKKKDETLFWNSIVLAPIFDKSRRIHHLVAISEDISEKKKMVEELKIAKEKAEESDRLKSLFLANMSHEIRTPLNGIIGFSNLICSGDAEPDKLGMYGTIIENSGRRLLSVIDDIIDISKIQANQLKIFRGKFDINDLIQELYVFYESQNYEKIKSVSFSSHLCENKEHRLIFSDKNRLYQVLRNLIDNAFKFTDKGSIVFGCCNSTDKELTMFVKDTGIGIQPEKKDLIFQSFRQEQEGSSRKYDGSGLGLAIVSGILERLGGIIRVESRPGSGSVFYFTLPRDNGEAGETEDTKLAQSKESKVQKGKCIVSVEDDKASFEYLDIVIKSLGYEHVSFDNALDVIKFLENHKPDLIFMDVQLPKMNGLEATKKIKATHPDIPVIIQTAYAMKTDMDKAYQAGCDDYITKPISLRILKEKIKKYLGNKSSENAEQKY